MFDLVLTIDVDKLILFDLVEQICQWKGKTYNASKIVNIGLSEHCVT